MITTKTMNRRIIKHIKPRKALLYVVMLGLVSFTVLPLVYVVVTSLKPYDELFRYPPRFFVENPTLKNFSDLFGSISASAVPFSRYILNSLVSTLLAVAGTILVSSLGAYGLTQHRPVGSKIIMTIVISALMFSSQVTIIPSYLVIKNVGLLNSIFSLVLPKLALSFNFFLMERFMSQIPRELIEAARVDAAGDMVIYWKIVMPCVRPAWATLLVFTFISSWNDYISPLMYIFGEDKKTLPLLLQTVGGGVGTAAISKAGAVAASSFVMIFPTIMIFVLMQRLVIETMTYSGIKA